MSPQKRGTNMLVPTIIMAAVAIALVALGYWRGKGEHLQGLRTSWQTTIETLPIILFSFVVAGMARALLPQDLLSRWVGTESGLRGLLIGAVAGSLTPGGPYVSLPVMAALLRAGASLGPMVAFYTGWALWSVPRLPMEVGILGWKVSLVRLASNLLFPPIAGWLAQGLYQLVK